MKAMLAVIASTALTVFCWGIYGVLLHNGQHGMGGSRLRPFLCVGLAYFAIAIVVPALILRMRGENGRWTMSGILWSLAAGAAGSMGALGIIMALTFGGMPVYVMPLVFGGAPVVNSFLTIYVARAMKQVGPLFLAGIIMVIAGAVTVLVFKPSTPGPHQAAPVSFLKVIGSVLLTVTAWGVYGTLLHQGQAKMFGSRLRPLIGVGLAYLVIAVIVPTILLSMQGEKGEFTTLGILWSLAGGSAGALGALGIILAFTFGGRPVYVMPLVFGGAPVVNTFVTMIGSNLLGRTTAVFYAGLILVVVGAAVTLLFAPREHPPAAKSPSPRKPAEEETAADRAAL